MKEKAPPPFPWSFLFIVLALSFILFSGVLKLINGSPAHTTIFLVTGILSFTAAIVASVSGYRKPGESSGEHG